MFCTFFAARETLGTLSRPSVLTTSETQQEKIRLYGWATMFLLGLALAAQALTRGYALKLHGENFAETAGQSSGETLVIGPMKKLAGTALMITLQSSQPSAARPQFRSFRLYRDPSPQVLEPKFHLQLIGRIGENDTVIAREIWPDSENMISDSEDASAYLEMEVKETCDAYFLRVLRPRSAKELIQTHIRIGVALKAKDCSRYREPELANATIFKNTA